jgi:hypothetical protein
MPYTTVVEMTEYAFRGQKYMIETPVKGLLVACVDNGFGSGTQTNYIVHSVRCFKTGPNKGKPSLCLLAHVKSIDPTTMIATCAQPMWHYLNVYITQMCWHDTPKAQICSYDLGRYVVEDNVGYMK